MTKSLITINKCRIENERSIIIPELNWEMKAGEVWLVIGPNGGGKADFVNALSGNLKMLPNMDGKYENLFQNSTDIVSLERAARLIQEERENDESEYVEGGVDIGRTGRVFITEGIIGTIKKGEPLPPEAKQLDCDPAVKLCGIEKILDRGLKYMSTGEIRRTLLARALISKKQFLILSDPFAGLDVQSRTILLDFFNNIAENAGKDENLPYIMLGMERWHEIPDAITNVIEFRDKKIHFCGSRADYEKIIKQRTEENAANAQEQKEAFADELGDTLKDTEVLQNAEDSVDSKEEAEALIEMNNVNVGWGDHQVLVDLNWRLNKNEHWLVRGPNGSGKTTFLELITGDNKQVYCNDIHIFGIKRGSGETIWDIKKHLGIVSYRLHVEYRMVGSTSLKDVIVSGFRDSIGLYEAATDVETAAAKKWLKLGGFDGRENETFGNLSYGEQRAILILRSAVKCPKILILDEPCHGLDEQYREKILQLMELIANGGTTTLLHVTHDPSEVLPCEKHILELHPNETPMYQIIEKNN
ncbi:MAG: ATP-binding cassette domain-containing protein [Treponema sp.]|nr:ATP-binding cassette domain-containing protein [Treponema sp.]